MNCKNLLLTLLAGGVFYSGNVTGQSVKPNSYGCLTDEHNQELEKLDPQFAQRRQALEAFIQQYRKSNKSHFKIAGPVMKIPVVVHIVTKTGQNGISKAQVQNGIDVLNEDFRRLNADTSSTRPLFKPFAADMEMEFVLAKIDPDGNPTEGINRVTSNTARDTYSAYVPNREQVKTAVPPWPSNKYFNVWLIENWNNDGFSLGGLAGYAQFPGTAWNTYGVVMASIYWGKSGAVPGSNAVTDGRTTTHEFGHCFNLYHTFQGGCGSNPKTSGDFCPDTPPVANSTQACNFNQNLCTNDVGQDSPYLTNVEDQIENYMSYDNCQNMFTEDQKERAHLAIAGNSVLMNLVSTANGDSTGINPGVVIGPLLPKAYFASSQTRSCAGSAPGATTTVYFSDASYNGPAPTAWNWSFPGGSPSTSNLSNPEVVYSTPGEYPVTLTSTNSNGTSAPTTVTNYIKVLPVTNLIPVAPGIDYVESFEDANFPANSIPNKVFERTSSSLAANPVNWEQTAAASTTGNFAMRLRNGSVPVPGTTSTLITPNLDVSAVPNNTLRVSLDIAYAMKNATSNDELKISYSSDCGKTWSTRKSLSGNSLHTNGSGNYVSGTFTPNASQWRTETVIGLTNISSGHVMFKIDAVSKSGNNSLFIDNLRVFTTAIAGVGTSEDLAARNNINVYPNPVTTHTGVHFELDAPEKVFLQIYDLVGNLVYNLPAGNFGQGAHTISLADKTKKLSSGMYMLRLSFGNKLYTTKLISE